MRRHDEQFLSLLRAQESKLFRIARALTGQEADAWDLLQESTLIAYDRFGQLRGGPEVFGPWIRRILVNTARNRLRQQSRTVPLELAEAQLVHDPSPGPEERLDQRFLWDEVMQLEIHHRQVLTLRYLADMPVEEIAALLESPSGTIKSRIHRALGALRRRLEGPAKGAVSQS